MNPLKNLQDTSIYLKLGDNDKLLIDAPKGILTPELKAVVKQHKAELVQILQLELFCPKLIPDNICASIIVETKSNPVEQQLAWWNSLTFWPSNSGNIDWKCKIYEQFSNQWDLRLDALMSLEIFDGKLIQSNKK